jgi:hypothetical protein
VKEARGVGTVWEKRKPNLDLVEEENVLEKANGTSCHHAPYSIDHPTKDKIEQDILFS